MDTHNGFHAGFIVFASGVYVKDFLQVCVCVCVRICVLGKLIALNNSVIFKCNNAI